MRISLAYSILIASSIQLLARHSNGQTIDKELVTIELQNDNLVAMVKKIEAQCDVALYLFAGAVE